MKEKLKTLLTGKGFEILDRGAFSEESTDYPDFMFKAAEDVKDGRADRAIGICYTGIGSAIAANKVTGVRAALVKTLEEAKLSRAHNDSNMLILGSGFLEPGIEVSIVETWLATNFEGGRHEQRVNKIKNYERGKRD